MILCTLEQAKTHLRVDDPASDADVMLKLIQASEIVVDYIKKPDHGWNEFTAPRVIQAAVLLVLSELYDQREGKDGIPAAAKALLGRSRDPALA
jgi:hypothetical protein